VSWFQSETAVEPVDASRWTAHVSDRWNIGDNPNGGYLAAIAVGALCRISPHPDPISVTAHFLRPGGGGQPAEVLADVVRSGRTITTARASLVQGGTARVEVLAAFADLSASSSPIDEALSVQRPVVPAPESCVSRSDTEQGVALPILDRLDVRIDPGQARAGQAGAAEVTGWIRLADGAEADVRSLLLFADAFPPSLFGLLGAVGWVPSVELTVHVRSRPAPGWVLGRFSTSDLRDGRMVEDGALWDSSGELVARSRQLGLLLPR